jgi:hypothetical protein
MLTPILPIRIYISIEAIGICWFISGIASGVRFRDPEVSFLVFLWSLPIFAFGWVLVGIPIIAMGNRILRVPKILLGITGAIAGGLVMLFPTFDVTVISRISFAGLRWSSLNGWPTFGAGIGASGVIIYSWLLSREIKRSKRAKGVGQGGEAPPQTALNR